MVVWYKLFCAVVNWRAVKTAVLLLLFLMIEYLFGKAGSTPDSKHVLLDSPRLRSRRKKSYMYKRSEERPGFSVRPATHHEPSEVPKTSAGVTRPAMLLRKKKGRGGMRERKATGKKMPKDEE